MSSPPGAQNVTLFRNRARAAVIRKDEVILGWDGPLIHCEWCPYKKRGETQGGDSHVMTEAGSGTRLFQAQGCWWPAEAAGGEEEREDFRARPC